MSSFRCPTCRALCVYTDRGYTQGCQHWPPDYPCEPCQHNVTRPSDAACEGCNGPGRGDD